MTDIKERHFSIDPGKGKKMDGCPYSIYEDGHDVEEYIIPPKGYVFVGFKFDPEATNQIYNGKLTAEYSKEPFKDRLKANLWKFILAFVIVAVISIIAILAAGVFKDPKPNRPTKETTTVVDTKDSKKDNDKKEKKDKKKKDRKKKNKEKKNKDKVAEENTATANVVEPQPVETVPEVKETQEEQKKVEPQPDVNDPNVQFKQEFWTLIHQRTIAMDPYDALYKENKNKVECEEYDYLRYTILKDYVSFKAWYTSLKKIPENQLQSIKSVDELKKIINEQTIL